MADDLRVQGAHDRFGLGQLGGDGFLFLLQILRDDVVAEVHALVADVDRGPGDQLPDLLTSFAAERAPQLGFGLLLFRHRPPSIMTSLRGSSRRRPCRPWSASDRKSTRLNSSHRCISYAVFCLKKKITY